MGDEHAVAEQRCELVGAYTFGTLVRGIRHPDDVGNAISALSSSLSCASNATPMTGRAWAKHRATSQSATNLPTVASSAVPTTPAAVRRRCHGNRNRVTPPVIAPCPFDAAH